MDRLTLRDMLPNVRNPKNEFIADIIIAMTMLLNCWNIGNWLVYKPDFGYVDNFHVESIMDLFGLIVAIISVFITMIGFIGIKSVRFRWMEMNYMQLTLPLLISFHIVLAVCTGNWVFVPLIIIYERFCSNVIQVCIEDTRERYEMDRNEEYLRRQTRKYVGG